MQADLNLATVQALMEARGIDSHAEMARRTKMERSYVGRVLRGERPAKPSHIVTFARALCVPPIVLVGPSDPDEIARYLENLPDAA